MNISKKKIEIIMATKGLMVKDVTSRSGVTKGNFSLIRQRGTCNPVTAGRIAGALGVDVTEILAD